VLRNPGDADRAVRGRDGNPVLQLISIQQSLHSVRIDGVAALPAGSEIAVGADQELWVCRVNITRANPLNCAGCAAPAGIWLDEIKLQSPNAPSQRITNEWNNNCLGLNGGSWNCYTPAQNRSWGAVKSLYR
jgi:hypothetical protein